MDKSGEGNASKMVGDVCKVLFVWVQALINQLLACGVNICQQAKQDEQPVIEAQGDWWQEVKNDWGPPSILLRDKFTLPEHFSKTDSLFYNLSMIK